MKNTGFTETELKYIKENHLKISIKGMARILGCSRTKVSNNMKKNGWIVPLEIKQGFRSKGLMGRTTATSSEDKFIKNNYLTMPVNAMATKLGRGETFIYTRLRRLGLIIPKEIIEQRKSDSQFSKGHEPVNKGLKQVDYMTTEQIKKSVGTRFKKGQVSANALHDGKITKRRDTLKTGEVIYYKWIRIAAGVWKMLHVHNWEKENGPVPDGNILVFSDGDRMNCELSNIECITLEENMRRNSIQNYPEEVRNLIIATGKLKARLTRKKEANGSKN